MVLVSFIMIVSSIKVVFMEVLLLLGSVHYL